MKSSPRNAAGDPNKEAVMAKILTSPALTLLPLWGMPRVSPYWSNRWFALSLFGHNGTIVAGLAGFALRSSATPVDCTVRKAS
jgi:hypothetical protein